MHRWFLFLAAGSAVASSKAFDHEQDCVDKYFTQETAPQRLSDIHRSLTDEVNRERVGEEIKLEIEWKGDFKDRKPGTYIIRAKLNGRPRCYRYIIEDVNECGPTTRKTHAAAKEADDWSSKGSQPGKAWVHQCHSSTECVNRNGTYECRCPMIESIGRRSTPVASKWPCNAKVDTGECCGDPDHLTHSQCKRDFACHTAMCGKDAQCDRNSVCTDHFNASGYTCACSEGLVGNGRICLDGSARALTATADPKTGSVTFVSQTGGIVETDPSKVCGCHKIEEKARCDPSQCCRGSIPCNEECRLDGKGCQCKADFTNDTTTVGGVVSWKCVDKTPPKVILFADERGLPVSSASATHHVTVKQCESYEDPGYDIDDDNKDKDMRKFEMRGNVPSGCLVDLATYNISFRVWTGPDEDPWAEDEVRRVVRVVDTDECALPAAAKRACPACLPKCAAEARCVNTVGSYRCACPVCGSFGDGFQKLDAGARRPGAYVNGTGCVDSCAPKLSLLGDAVKVFKVCKCDGPLCPDAVVDWGARLNDLLATTPGVLCPTQRHPCATALDRNMDGLGYRDISSRIVVGNPVHVRGLTWKIPYDVDDENGNQAMTVFREVQVRPLTISQIEQEAIAERSGVAPPASLPSRASATVCPNPPKPEPCACNSTAAGSTPPNVFCPPGDDPRALPMVLLVLVALLCVVLCGICVLKDEDPSTGSREGRGRIRVQEFAPRRDHDRSQVDGGSFTSTTSPGGYQYSPQRRFIDPQR